MNPLYISPEEYAQAEENDIPARVLYARINYHGWSKEEALIHPPGKRRKRVKYGAVTVSTDQWYYVAKENRISPQTYHKRLGRGWSPERAATAPAITKFHPNQKRSDDMDIQRGQQVRFTTSGRNPSTEVGEVLLFLPKGEDAYEMPRPIEDRMLMASIAMIPKRRRRFQPVNQRSDRYLVAVHRKGIDGGLLNSIDYYAPIAGRIETV